ncbi:MAG: hypothetical protein RID15_13880 [Marinovum algicola]|jgi:hypothetical protein|uniref:hypothetical protein n=1 Tax=Marinovum algicola TaxID=42444 RepID=UPI0032EBCEDC
MSENGRHDDLAAVAFFLAGAEEDKAIYAGRTGNDAFESFCRLMGWPADKVRRIAQGEGLER